MVPGLRIAILGIKMRNRLKRRSSLRKSENGKSQAWHRRPDRARTTLAFDAYVGFDKALVAIQVIARAKTRELEKLAYEMGLIEVS